MAGLLCRALPSRHRWLPPLQARLRRGSTQRRLPPHPHLRWGPSPTPSLPMATQTLMKMMASAWSAWSGHVTPASSMERGKAGCMSMHVKTHWAWTVIHFVALFHILSSVHILLCIVSLGILASWLLDGPSVGTCVSIGLPDGFLRARSAENALNACSVHKCACRECAKAIKATPKPTCPMCRQEPHPSYKALNLCLSMLGNLNVTFAD